MDIWITKMYTLQIIWGYLERFEPKAKGMLKEVCEVRTFVVS